MNKNKNNNKTIRYPKEYYNDEDYDDDKYNTKNKKNIKYNYPKKENTRKKTPNSSHINKYRKLPEIKDKAKKSNSVNKNKKSNFSLEQKKEEENNNINNINLNNQITTNNNKDFFEEYEKNLMINLHDVNMRRSISQMETKHSQSSIIDEENIDINKKKSSTQNKIFLFTNDKGKNPEKISNDIQ